MPARSVVTRHPQCWDFTRFQTPNACAAFDLSTRHSPLRSCVKPVILHRAGHSICFSISNRQHSCLERYSSIHFRKDCKLCILDRSTEPNRSMEKSPLLANGYNPPPTHLNPMQFMALNHAAQQAAAAAAAQHALLGSPGSAMHQGSLPAGIGNHHSSAQSNQTSTSYGAHHSAASAVHHGLMNRPESSDMGKGASSVDHMAAAR